ncbi:MAG TPA: FtsX-like permease family protein [Gammaproteobacteria bacterium]|nr:FtsX-like permease family protein [Gammaproteobacteria bacterium]
MSSADLFRYILPAINMWRIKRLQALLSIAGIAIGVAGFVVVVAMAQGAREEFSRAVGVLGTGTVIVNSTAADDSPQLNSEMLFNLKRLVGHELSAMAPVQHEYRTAYLNRKQQRVRLVGTSASYREVFSLAMASGRFLAPYDLQHRQRVAVLGLDIAIDLFSTTQVTGRMLRLGKEWFTVVGVLGSNKLPLIKLASFQTPDTSRAIYIPMTVMSARAVDDLAFSQLLLKFAEDQRIPAATPLLHRIFGASRFKQQKLELIIPYELLIKKKQFQNLLELFLLGISTIILAVGVTGVLNVMLVSVNTRRSEIGLRRAVGATKNDILQQFMVEGVLLAVIGGSIGLFVGWGLGSVVTSWFELPVVFDIQTILTGFFVAFLAGVLSTIYPAIKAAGLRPVEALKT